MTRFWSENCLGDVILSFHCLMTSKCVILENTLVSRGPIYLSKRVRTASEIHSMKNPNLY